MAASKRILLADDHASDVELTLAALAEQHLAQEAEVVADGAQALDYLFRRGLFADRSAGNPAVVLLDLALPRAGGLEIVRAIRADPLLSPIPVVIFTSAGEPGDIVAGYKAGVNGYVVKPVDPGEYANAIQHVSSYWAVINEQPVGSSPNFR